MENPNNHVFTTIEIKAPASFVWQVLTDWDRLEEWSSTFVGISTSELKVGQEFISYFKSPIGKGRIELKHICTDYVEGEKFGWSGDIVGKIKDHHIYSLEPTQWGTTIFKQEDGFHGPYNKFFNFLSEHKMTALYNRFNKELKKRVETLYPNV